MIINFRGLQRLLTGAGLAATAVIASQSPSFAHVTLATGEARANTYYKAVFQVPHGCDGAATQTVRIQIPEGVIGVKPMPKAGHSASRVARTPSHTRAMARPLRKVRRRSSGRADRWRTITMTSSSSPVSLRIFLRGRRSLSQPLSNVPRVRFAGIRSRRKGRIRTA